MVTAKTKIVNPQGMHMRPAQLFVNTMAKYNSDVTILFNGKEINAKSIMQEADALKAAVELVESGLGE